MRKNQIDKIEGLEERLSYTSPEKVASVVKKLVKAKDSYINGR